MRMLMGLVGLMWAGTVLAADPPGVITHQGRLLDIAGAPLNGEQSLIVNLYNGQNGPSVWDETVPVVAADGYFSTVLGTTDAITPADVDVSELWVGVSADGGATEVRSRVGTVPYALRATTAVSADTATTAVNVDGGDLTNIGNFFWARISVADGTFGNSLGATGTVPISTSAGGEGCSGNNVCVRTYQHTSDRHQYRAFFKIPTEFTNGWFAGSDVADPGALCWGATSGDNEGAEHHGFVRGVRAVGSDQNGHCDAGGVINTCAYVDIDVDHLSHSIYGIMCYKP